MLGCMVVGCEESMLGYRPHELLPGCGPVRGLEEDGQGLVALAGQRLLCLQWRRRGVMELRFGVWGSNSEVGCVGFLA